VADVPSDPPARYVYLAGPDGFTPAGLYWHQQVLIPAVLAAGLQPLSPWDASDDDFAEVAARPEGPDRRLAYRNLDFLTGDANAALIDRSSGVLAVLDGPDVDSGTAAEIGYATKAGLAVVGLRTDSRRTGDNEGVIVNLQVEYFIRRSGGSIHTHLEAAVGELATLVGA
jgi:nucleoside 2-deoxyribosyltransferase